MCLRIRRLCYVYQNCRQFDRPIYRCIKVPSFPRGSPILVVHSIYYLFHNTHTFLAILYYFKSFSQEKTLDTGSSSPILYFIHLFLSICAFVFQIPLPIICKPLALSQAQSRAESFKDGRLGKEVVRQLTNAKCQNIELYKHNNNPIIQHHISQFLPIPPSITSLQFFLSSSVSKHSYALRICRRRAMMASSLSNLPVKRSLQVIFWRQHGHFQSLVRTGMILDFSKQAEQHGTCAGSLVTSCVIGQVYVAIFSLRHSSDIFSTFFISYGVGQSLIHSGMSSTLFSGIFSAISLIVQSEGSLTGVSRLWNAFRYNLQRRQTPAAPAATTKYNPPLAINVSICRTGIEKKNCNAVCATVPAIDPSPAQKPLPRIRRGATLLTFGAAFRAKFPITLKQVQINIMINRKCKQGKYSLFTRWQPILARNNQYLSFYQSISDGLAGSFSYFSCSVPGFQLVTKFSKVRCSCFPLWLWRQRSLSMWQKAMASSLAKLSYFSRRERGRFPLQVGQMLFFSFMCFSMASFSKQVLQQYARVGLVGILSVSGHLYSLHLAYRNPKVGILTPFSSKWDYSPFGLLSALKIRVVNLLNFYLNPLPNYSMEFVTFSNINNYTQNQKVPITINQGF